MTETEPKSAETEPKPTEPKPTVFFIDRCLGRVKLATALRKAGITVQIHDDHFPQNAEDENWLPEVGESGWIVLTKDKSIAKRTFRATSGGECQYPHVCWQLKICLGKT